MHRLIEGGVALMLISLLVGCSSTYTSEPIRGKVVDAGSKQPIAGVNVLVTWSVYFGTHRGFEGYLEVKEAVTNENGEFYIEGWGPKRNSFWGALTVDEPKMIVFKPWYHMELLTNPWTPSESGREHAPKHLRFILDNQTIEIRPVVDSAKYLEESLDAFDTELSNFYYGKTCDWAKAPNFISSLQRLFKELSKLDARFKGEPMHMSDIHMKNGCPSLESVFGKDYQ